MEQTISAALGILAVLLSLLAFVRAYGKGEGKLEERLVMFDLALKRLEGQQSACGVKTESNTRDIASMKETVRAHATYDDHRFQALMDICGVIQEDIKKLLEKHHA